MSFVNSSSTLSQVKAAYYDNASYDLDGGGTAMCQSFIAACRQLLLRLSKRVGHGNKAEEVEIDPGVLERQIAAAKQWLFLNNNQQGAPLTRVFSRGEQFTPTFPGPYYG
jgi:hypothetical protein